MRPNVDSGYAPKYPQRSLPEIVREAMGALTAERQPLNDPELYLRPEDVPREGYGATAIKNLVNAAMALHPDPIELRTPGGGEPMYIDPAFGAGSISKKMLPAALEALSKRKNIAQKFMAKPEPGPGRLFHGTPNAFDKFSETKIGSTTDPGVAGRGFYFSSEPGGAGVYAMRQGGNIRPVTLDVNNPLRLRDDLSEETIEKIAKSMQGLGLQDTEAYQFFTRKRDPRFSGEKNWDILRDLDQSPGQISEIIRGAGFDSIHYNPPVGEQTWVAFDPEKINPSFGARKQGLSATEKDFTKLFSLEAIKELVGKSRK